MEVHLNRCWIKNWGCVPKTRMMTTSSMKSIEPTLSELLFQTAAKYSVCRIYSQGDTIFTEGDAANTMLLLLRGSVAVNKASPDSGEIVEIATGEAGEFFGEMALLEQSTRFATVVAKTECAVLEFSWESFERIISEEPSLATTLLRSLSRKLRESDSFRIDELEERNKLLDASVRELTRLNTFLDCVIDQSPTAIFLVSNLGRINRMNKAAAEMFDKVNDENEMVMGDLFSGLELSDLLRHNSGTWHGEVTGFRGSDRFPAYVSVTSLMDHDGSVLHLVICQDITELQAFNETVREIEKYSSAQQTATEMAHDLKNYFGAVTCGVDLMVENLETSQRDKLQRTIHAINDSIEKIMLFVNNAMEYGKDQEHFAPMDLESVTRAVIRFCKTQVRFQDVELSLRISEPVPERVPMIEVQIQSAILNLLVNACEAFDGLAPDAEKRVGIELTSSSDGRNALLTVSDNGPGIDKKLLPKLFKERQTTKSTGHGIGLVSVGRIVHNHSGDITVDSRPGEGTAFRISLPICRELADA